jgi:hypothetical protein
MDDAPADVIATLVVGMRVRHGIGHLREEVQSRTESEAPVGGVMIDACALDVLQHETRLTNGRDARVEEPGNVGTGEARERGALTPEALLPAAAIQQGQIHELQCDVGVEAAIAAAR